MQGRVNADIPLLTCSLWGYRTSFHRNPAKVIALPFEIRLRIKSLSSPLQGRYIGTQYSVLRPQASGMANTIYTLEYIK